MRAAFLIGCISLLFAGCKDSNHIPDNILPQAQMKQVLWDITRADLFLADYWLRKDSTLDKRTESLKLYQQIFNLHHTSKEEFQRSFTFYRNHPLLFKPVLDSLSAHINDPATDLAKPDTTLPAIRPRMPGQGPDTSLFKKAKRKNLKKINPYE